MNTLTITRPDDWHIHLRDGRALEHTVADCSRYLARAIIMPNLVPPVVTVAAAEAYYQRISNAVPEGRVFEPLMTLYLTADMTRDTVIAARDNPRVHGFKLYPAGATTNSDSGIDSIAASYPLFEVMEEYQVPLLIHGEVNDPDVDIFDREAVFIDRHLEPLQARFPALRIVLEHITTSAAVDWVSSAPDQVAATITAHHLLFNRNHLLAGGIKPVYYCLPVLKRDTHQRALIAAATSANPKFFLGTDSAPHPRLAKENALGCAAGIYTAHAAIELYAEVFESQQKLHLLEGFASHYGADFYQLPRNQDTITLAREEWLVPSTMPMGADTLIPIRAGQSIQWKVVNSTC